MGPADSPPPETSSRKSHPRLVAGVRVIVAYKWIKSLLQLVLAITLIALIFAGLAEHLHSVALVLRQHVVSVWSTRLADLLLTVTTDRHLALTAVALALDGILTFIEGWSLWSGYAWGPWLVVIATSGLVPFEIRELLHEFRLGRLLILLANVSVVAYLVYRAQRESRLRGRTGESSHRPRVE